MHTGPCSFGAHHNSRDAQGEVPDPILRRSSFRVRDMLEVLCPNLRVRFSRSHHEFDRLTSSAA